MYSVRVWVSLRAACREGHWRQNSNLHKALDGSWARKISVLATGETEARDLELEVSLEIMQSNPLVYRGGNGMQLPQLVRQVESIRARI